MTPSSALPSRNRTGLARFLPHWVPMLFVGGFVVVIGVNVTLIVFAERTFSGLETASPYERGLTYNQTLAAEAAQEQLGWQSTATIGAGNPHTLGIDMTDRGGRPLTGLSLRAYLVRPSNEGQDIALAPEPIGDGHYRAIFALPALGQWELRIVATDGERTWQHSERMFVK